MLSRRQWLGIAGTVGLGGYLSATFFEGIDEETRERYVSVATQTASRLTEWRAARSRTLRLLSEFDVLREGTTEDQRGFLKDAVSNLPEDVIRVHLVATSDRTVLASTDPVKDGEPFTTREAPWEVETLEYGDDDVFVAEAVEALGAALVSFVTPMTDDRVLVLQSDLEAVATGFPIPSNDGYSAVINASGNVVTENKRRTILEPRGGEFPVYDGGADAPAVRRGLDGESGFIAEPAINDRDGIAESYYVTFAPVEGFPWVVISHVPKDG